MRKMIYVLTIALVLSLTTAHAQETGPSTDITAGYTGSTFDGVSSGGFNIGIALLDCASPTGMYYGIDCSYTGLFDKTKDYQSILSIGPTTGVRFMKKSGYTFEIGVGSGLSIVKLYDKTNQLFDKECLNGKTKIGMGYKNYLIQFEGGYYMNSEKDFTSFSIGFKYIFK